MTAFGVLLRRGPVRTLSATAASVLILLGAMSPTPAAAADALAEQRITWTGTPDTPLTAGTVSVAAVASSGLPVQYTSTSTDVCTADGDVVTLHRHGRCTIRATQPGNGSFAAAEPASDTFAVLGRAQTITWSPTPDTAVAAGTVQVSATATSGLAVTYASATPRTCKVKGHTVTLVAGGTCTVHADQRGDDEYAAAPRAADTFHIAKTPQTITFARPDDTSMNARTVRIDPAATSGITVTVTSAARDVCTVRRHRVTLVGTGTCVLRADQRGNGRYAAAPRVVRSFAVGRGRQSITFPAPGPAALADGTVTIAPAANSGLPVTVTGLDQAVCTVAGTTVTLHATGTCVLRAQRPAAPNWTAAPDVEVRFTVGRGTQRTTFTVTRGGQRITFAQPPGRSFTDGPLTVAPAASSYLPVVLSSGSPRVCTVQGYAVTPVAAGACILRADQPGNRDWAPAPRVTRTVRIAPAVQTVAFAAPPPAAVSDGPVTLTATATSGLPVTYSTTSAGTCTVDGATVTLLAAGACPLVARQDGDRRFAAAPDVTATLTVLQDPVPVTVPAAAPPTAGGLRNAAGDATAAGAAITLHGGGYKPGTAVQVVVYSTPRRLGTAFAGADGTFTLLVVVPEDLHRGGHTLLAAGLAADNTLRYLTVPVAVSAAARSLPVTGGPVGTVAALGTWAVLIGIVLALLGRRRGWRLRHGRWVYRWTYRGRHALAA